METWISITKAAKMMDRTLNGVRFYLGRCVRFRKVEKGKRTVTEVHLEDLQKLIPKLRPRRNDQNSFRRRKCPSTGYILVYHPKHPRAMSGGDVYEHWLVAEEMLKRHLTAAECVHHINRVRDDNRPENLHVYPDKGTHMKLAHAEWREFLKKTHGTGLVS